ncbi:MAG: right-handed parallel beta-helix repeat-containing protein [Luteimonas sp.]|nr:right-handed parallel beta-helix repeat-containing protein [Luteimonas sp.]
MPSSDSFSQRANPAPGFAEAGSSAAPLAGHRKRTPRARAAGPRGTTQGPDLPAPHALQPPVPASGTALAPGAPGMTFFFLAGSERIRRFPMRTHLPDRETSMTVIRLLTAPALLVGALFLPPSAQAAESYDNCSHFIDSVPATITSSGVWCLDKDLSTAIASGNAISISANNVVLDCNHFKLGGLAAGNGSRTLGIAAFDRQNITVRNCNIRGFNIGILLSEGSGHLVEHNRLDNNLITGIYLSAASNSIVRENRVYDTGGYPDNNTRYGIRAYGGDAIEVTHNIVAGVFGTSGYGNHVIGIDRLNYVSDVDMTSARITGNRVSGLVPSGTGTIAYGLNNSSAGSTYGMNIFAGNDLFMATPVSGSVGIQCSYNGISVRNNNIRGFATAVDSICLDDGGNVAH